MSSETFPGAWPAGVVVPDRQAIEAYLALPIAQRQLLRELIRVLGEGAQRARR